jgi:exopolysaccharide biosynthesis WecB/TagA/CpsF family protein
MAGELLLRFLDLTSFLVGAWISNTVYARDDGYAHAAAWFAAMLAPFVLHDRYFAAAASRGRAKHLAASFAARYLALAGIVVVVGVVTRTLDHYPRGWLSLWFGASLVLASGSRLVVAAALRYLQLRGSITESIAIVGAGPIADRLVHTLLQDRPDSIELLGVFDERRTRMESEIAPSGDLAQLIDLGKSRKIDWILLALPPSAEARVLAIVNRLMALAVPIGLCPQHVGSHLPFRSVEYAADGIPVIPLIECPSTARGARHRDPNAPVLMFDDYDLDRFTAVATGFGAERYGYVVTPNADHVIHLSEIADFRTSYANADYVLLDSRFLSHLLRITRGVTLPVCTGSDLTARLLSSVIQPTDSIVLIGATTRQADHLRSRFDLQRLEHFNPPMGFIKDPAAVEECLAFIERQSPFRFCLLAVGTPQQEFIAQRLKARGHARGLTLCVGASIDFVTGDQRRAPRGMQQLGLEWLYRLVKSPARLANRYLIRGPRVFRLLRRCRIALRAAQPPILHVVPSGVKPPPPRDVAVQAAPAETTANEPVPPRISAAS